MAIDDAALVAELRRLDGCADPMPWWADSGPWVGTRFGVLRASGESITDGPFREFAPDVDKHNAQLVATMRNALPRLLDLAEEAIRLRGEVELAVKQMAEFAERSEDDKNTLRAEIQKLCAVRDALAEERAARREAHKARYGARDLDAHRLFAAAEELRGKAYAALDAAKEG